MREPFPPDMCEHYDLEELWSDRKGVYRKGIATVST